MNKRDDNSSDFINFGTYSASEADILKTELEKNGIPVKILYPGTNVGRESVSEARWTVYTILIPAKDRKVALEICSKLNIKPKYKIPLPEFLYTKSNRYILGIIIFLWMLMIIFGLSGILESKSMIGGLIGVLILITIILFLIINGYKTFKGSS